MNISSELRDELVKVVKGINFLSRVKNDMHVKLSKVIDIKKVEGIFNEEMTIDDLDDDEKLKFITVIYEFAKDERFNPKQLTKDNSIRKSKKELTKDDMPNLYYDFDFKVAFATTYPKDTKRVLMALFRKTMPFERANNKDLYHFNKNELIEVFKSLKAKTVRSLQDKISKVEQYIEFAMNNERTKVNYAKAFNSKDKIEDLLDKEAEENMIFDKDEIMEMAMYADNPQDGVILGLLFDGVSHKNEFEEMRDLTKNDVDYKKQEISLPDRTIPISTETVILIDKALKEDTYISINGEKTRKYKIAEGINIIRGLRDKAKVKGQIINQRLLRIKEKFDYPFLNATTISYSGQIHYASKLIEEGIKIDEAVPIVLERFSIPNNDSSRFYLRTRIEKYLSLK